MSSVNPLELEKQAPTDLGAPVIPDILFDVEVQARTVEALIELAERPDPFKRNRSTNQEFFSEEDLNLLVPIKPTVRELESGEGFANRQEAIDTLRPVVLTAGVLTNTLADTWRTQYDVCVNETKKSAERLDEAGLALGRLESRRDEYEEYIPVTELGELYAQLDVAATILPNTRTLDTLGDFPRASRDVLEYIKSATKYFVLAQPSMRRLVNEGQLRIEHAERRTTAARGVSTRLAGRGSKLFGDVQLFIKNERSREAIELLDALASARCSLQKQAAADPDRLPELLGIDARIDELTRFATAALKNGDTTPEQAIRVTQTANRIGSLSLRAQVEQKHAETMTHLARPLSTAITTAKNVLRGGHKIEEDNPRVKELAANLYGLADGKKRKIFHPEHSGILVAIITDRFEEFVQTIERVHARHENDQELHHVLQNRPEAARDLVHFRLPEAISHILDVLKDPRDRAHVFSSLHLHEQQKVEAFLAVTAQAEAA